MADLKIGLFRLPAHILKEKFSRCTLISYEMQEVLEKLRDEQRKSKIENMQGYVFTRRYGRTIRDITRAFSLALERAKLQNSNITPHSFRRACISRWTDLGVPRDFVMLFSGHKPRGVPRSIFKAHGRDARRSDLSAWLEEKVLSPIVQLASS